MVTKSKSKRLPRPALGEVRGSRQPGVVMALSRERIAAVAMALVDREGLETFSTRRLGRELGCEAMSIYHHFPSKAHLMDALVDLMLAEARVAMPDDAGWLDRLRLAAHGFRAMALRHPRFFPFFAVHRLNTASGVAYIDGIIGILRDAGFGEVIASKGDAAALRDLVLARAKSKQLKKANPIIYLAGADLARDLASELGENGFTVVTQTTSELPASIEPLFSGEDVLRFHGVVRHRHRVVVIENKLLAQHLEHARDQVEEVRRVRRVDHIETFASEHQPSMLCAGEIA